MARSTAYFGIPEAADRIATHIPRCKIICTFRNPVERIYSAYKLWRHYTLTFDPLDVFLEKVPQVIEVSRYATHLPEYHARFGDDRVLVCSTTTSASIRRRTSTACAISSALISTRCRVGR